MLGPCHLQLLSESKKLPYAIINDNIDVTARVHSERDARLIAAAPEMYEVLSELLDTLEMSKGYGFDEEYEKLREVIAKVDGGEG